MVALLFALNLAPTEGDFVIKDFPFRSGEKLAELRLHYLTLGKPVRDAAGHVTNAVLVLHGTTGSGRQFLSPQFAEVLYGPGQPLDVTKYYVILPDGIGHGKSSKPSDGLHARFPKYGYEDMVAAQHALVTDGLKVDHLRLILGTSMGCMHAWMWGERWPKGMDALMPLACLPVQIAGRNRMMRKMIIDGIQGDPEWKGGEYTAQPRAAKELAVDISIIAGSATVAWQKAHPTRESAEAFLDERRARVGEGFDANDELYAWSASRDYDPSADLEKIEAAVMFVNFGDDFINPPELGIAEHQIKRVKRGKFVLLPASETSHGHGGHTWAEMWQGYLVELLAMRP
jgi:homoserine O-acetyltransferase